MHPSALLPELLAQSSLPRFAHSALPAAPVRTASDRRLAFSRLMPTKARRNASRLTRRP